MIIEALSGTTTVPASADAVFRVPTGPANHAAIDGTGWVCETRDGERLTTSKQVFRMNMYHLNHPDARYETANSSPSSASTRPAASAPPNAPPSSPQTSNQPHPRPTTTRPVETARSAVSQLLPRVTQVLTWVINDRIRRTARGLPWVGNTVFGPCSKPPVPCSICTSYS